MTKLPVVSGRELVKILGKVGFRPSRQRGSHVVLVRTDENGKRAVVIPDHKEIDKGTLIEIIREAGLKREEFLRLFK
jgi:predicted RNA binding protein YcfA (HicA-like mRNA interferase family)